MAKKVLTKAFSTPLDGAKQAAFDIDANTGNLNVGCLARGEQELASGELQYLEDQTPPQPVVETQAGRARFALQVLNAKSNWKWLPWAACNGATEWMIRLNPEVSARIKAHSGGGNIQLDLAGMSVEGLTADTGGGNVDVVLPEDAQDLSVDLRSGAGNVKVSLGKGTRGKNSLAAESGAGNVEVAFPQGLAARICASSGMGRIILDPRFKPVDAGIWQSQDFEGAADRVEITLKSGAGNVIVKEAN